MVSAAGVRQTVNANLSAAQITWNLRSALNVAALNCQDSQYLGLVDNYSAFLKRNERQLSLANKTVQGEFRQRYGSTARDVQDTYMTQVYNYFALPPAKREFCQVAYGISGEVMAIEPAQLDVFASTALPRIEGVFENFFRAYEQYRVDLNAWNLQYGPPEVTGTLPGSGSFQDNQTPVVITTGETAPDGQPVISLPTEGPIFVSGEVVQQPDDAKADSGAEDDSPPS